MRTTELISKPFEVEMVRDQGRLVEINIRAVGEDGELDHDAIREATRAIIDYTRRERHEMFRMTRADSDALRSMASAYERGHGKVTDEYLARLALAYAEVATDGRNVSTVLARVIGKPLPTVKGHIMRARREGFLTEATQGKEGGEPTAKAQQTIAALVSEG